MANNERSFFKKVLSVFVTNGVLFVVGMGSSILSARLLGPEGKGVVGSAVALSGIGTQFLNFGMHGSHSYQLAKNPSCMNRVAGNNLLMAALAAVCGGLLYAVVRQQPEWTASTGVMLGLVCLYIPLSLYQLLIQNAFLGVGRVGVYNRLNLINGLGYPAMLLCVAVLGVVSPETVFLCTLAASGLVVVCGLVRLKPLLGEGIRLDITFFRNCLPFGIKSYMACLGSYLVIRSDVLMIRYFLGEAQTGIYTVSVNLSDIVGMVPGAVSILLFPEAASMTSDCERAVFMRKVLVRLAIVMAGLTMAAWFLSGIVIPILYGMEYAPSVRAFQILMPAVFFMSLQSVLSNYFAAKNMWTGNIVTPFIGLAVNFSMNAVLIPRMGIEGAASASVVSYGAMMAVMLARFIGDSRRIEKELRKHEA